MQKRKGNVTKDRSGPYGHYGPILQSVRWQNFRGFSDTGDVPLHKLTIITGPNNSGKSSLIAPLLVIKQSMFSTDLSRPLITKGIHTDVGSYSDYVYGGNAKKAITFGLRFHGHEIPPSLATVEKFEDPPGEVEFTVQATPSSGLELSNLKIFDIYRRLYLQRKLSGNGKYSVEGPLCKKIDKKSLQELTRQKPRGFLFGTIDSGLWDLNKDRRRITIKQQSLGIILYNAINTAVREELRRMFAELAYIGPMRNRPARFYEHTGESPSTVGPRGQHAYEMLFRERTQLESKLNRAVRRLNLCDAIECVGISNNLDVFSVKLRMGRLRVNLADAGFGVSQLMPILIQGFLRSAKRPSDYKRLIIKQPEIHLNPAQQSVFAELTVEMLDNTSIVIETHSEHFLLTIRRLIAEGKIDSTDVGLFYVEKLSHGQSAVRQVPIASNGHIEANDWPKGFLNESMREALALAAAQVRHAQDGGANNTNHIKRGSP